MKIIKMWRVTFKYRISVPTLNMVINKKTNNGHPDWGDAPEWAEYLVHDMFTGQWVWLEKHPRHWHTGKILVVVVEVDE